MDRAEIDTIRIVCEIANKREVSGHDVIIMMAALSKGVVPLLDEFEQLRTENNRLAGLIGSVSEEAEMLKRERDDLQAQLARTKQLAVSLTERPTR